MSRVGWVRMSLAGVIGGCVGLGIDVGWLHVVVILVVAIAGYVVAWGLPE